MWTARPRDSWEFHFCSPLRRKSKISIIQVCSFQSNWEIEQDLAKKEDRETFRKCIVDVLDVMRENTGVFSSILFSSCTVL